MSSRLGIEKTYKFYVGGKFARSESGRVRQVVDHAGGESAKPTHVPWASRKDLRDAVRIAAKAHPGWAAKTPYLRGQILYRLAEMLDGRAAQLAASLVRGAGLSSEAAAKEVDASIDYCVSCAGWSDKFGHLLGSSNMVSGPHASSSSPEPMGVVGIVAPDNHSLYGLVRSILPVIVSGNSCVVLTSETDPRTAIEFAECLATCDLPGGVVNLLTGLRAEIGPHLAKHMEVAGLAIWEGDQEFRTERALEGADTVKRVHLGQLDGENLETQADLSHLEGYLEIKTFWHPLALLQADS